MLYSAGLVSVDKINKKKVRQEKVASTINYPQKNYYQISDMENIEVWHNELLSLIPSVVLTVTCFP